MKKNSIIMLFYKSLYSFKDIAKFRFIDIGKTLQFVFILALLYFIPSFIKSIVIDRDSTNLIPGFDAGSLAIIIPIFIVFMYILNVGIIILKISILAYIALFIAKWLNRKLPYRQSFRLTAFSITLPTLLFGLEPLFSVKIPYGVLIDAIIALIYIYLSIKTMPLNKKS